MPQEQYLIITGSEKLTTQIDTDTLLFTELDLLTRNIEPVPEFGFAVERYTYS